MAISFVGKTSATSSGNDTSFQFTKPSGVVAGDFMIGVVAHFSSRSEDPERVTVTPPTGWTMVADLFSSGVNSIQLNIMTKVAGSSEPSTWSGSYNDTQSTEVQGCAVYRGVAGIVASDTTTAGETTSLTVGPVTNPTATNWRVVIGAYASNTVNYAIESSEVIERLNGSIDPDTGVEMSVWDSNGTISTGSTSRTVRRDSTWGTGAGWIGILDAQDVSIPGTLSGTLPLITMTSSGSIAVPGTLAAPLPLLTMTAEGIASPPEGALSASILPVVAVEGAVHPTGTVDVVITPLVEIVSETRKFGIRVVTPEAETRVTRPRLGAVD